MTSKPFHVRNRRFSGIDQNLMNLSSEPVAKILLSGEKQTLRIYGSLFEEEEDDDEEDKEEEEEEEETLEDEEETLELSSAGRDADVEEDEDEEEEEEEDWGDGG